MFRPQISAKTTSPEKPVTPKSPMANLKCYNCFELGHISYDYTKPKTEWTKQILTTKLAVVEPPKAPGELENEDP